MNVQSRVKSDILKEIDFTLPHEKVVDSLKSIRYDMVYMFNYQEHVVDNVIKEVIDEHICAGRKS